MHTFFNVGCNVFTCQSHFNLWFVSVSVFLFSSKTLDVRLISFSWYRFLDIDFLFLILVSRIVMNRVFLESRSRSCWIGIQRESRVLQHPFQILSRFIRQKMKKNMSSQQYWWLQRYQWHDNNGYYSPVLDAQLGEVLVLRRVTLSCFFRITN